MCKFKINNLKPNKIKDLQLDIPLEVKNYFENIGLPIEIIQGVYNIMEMGAIKHGRDTWLDQDNPSMQPLSNLSSISRHNAQAHFGDSYDKESGRLHFWHIATRGIMKAVRYERGIDE